MIRKKRSVYSAQDHFRLWVLLLVELHCVMNSFPRIGKQRRDVDDVGFEPYVLVASNEFDIISLALVECGDLQKTKRGVTRIVIWLYQEDAFTQDLIPPAAET